ncbi:MAG: hypothetical protein LC803_09375 [Acidobacteria bacterium]|nr:hypothetical protein [Acidobacteriota bacterium]
MAVSNDNSQADKSDPALDKALKRFKDSWDYSQKNWHDKWDRDNKLYDNERVYAWYEGVTNTFVPMVFSTIETMVAAFNNASTRFQFKSSDPRMGQSSDTIKAANGLIEEWWDEDQWDLIVEEGGRETFITGMAGNMVSWEGDHPHVESYAMRDMIVDPTIKHPAQLQTPGHYAGRRYFVRKGELDDYEVVDTDPDSKTHGELIPRYKKSKHDTGGAGSNMGQESDKESKEIWSGSVLGRADEDEIIEIWDVDRVVTVKNRKDVIEDVVNPYKQRHEFLMKQKYLNANLEASMDLEAAEKDANSRSKSEAKGVVPFFFFRNYRRLSLFYAKSEIDSIAKEQELLNDMTNMESDYIIRQLSPQRELEPKYSDFIDLVNNDPDTTYPFPPGTLVNIQPPVLQSNSFNNRLNLKNEIRETTAIDQVAKGAQNTADATATEVRAQLNQTGQRIQSKARIFEKDGFYWWGWILMKMMQLYVDEPLAVEVPGGGGMAVFDPAKFAEVDRVSVQLDVDAASKQEEERQAYLTAYQILIQDPTNNPEEIKRRILPKALPKLDQEDLDAITTPAPGQGLPQLPMGGPQGAMAGAPPEGAPPAPAAVPPEVAQPVEEVVNG